MENIGQTPLVDTPSGNALPIIQQPILNTQGQTSATPTQNTQFKVGSGYIERSQLEDALSNNLQSFLDHYSSQWGSAKTQLVYEAISDVMGDIHNGMVIGREADRTIRFRDNRVRGGDKNDDPYRVAAYFINQVVDVVKKDSDEAAAAKKKADVEANKKKKYSPTELANNFLNYQFAGSPENAQQIWSGLDEGQQIEAYRTFLTNELQNLDTQYDGAENGFSDLNDVRGRLTAALLVLEDGRIDPQEKLTLAKAGIGKGFFTAQEPKTSQQIIGDKLLARMLATADRIAQWNWDLEDSDYLLPTSRYNNQIVDFARKRGITDFAGTVRHRMFPNFFKQLNTWLAPEKLREKDILIDSPVFGRIPASQYVINMLDYAVKHRQVVDNGSQEFNLLSDGSYTIPGSFDEKTGTILIYKPNRQTLSRVSITKYNELLQHYGGEAGLFQPPATLQLGQTLEFKSGGVLKLAYGGTPAAFASALDGEVNGYLTDDLLNLIFALLANPQQEAKLAELKADSEASAEELTPALKAGLRKLSKSGDDNWQFSELSAADKARLGAMTADVIGLIGSFVPGYGTAVAGITGLGSLGAHLYADISDESASKWDVVKNAGINLGLGALSLIPGGGSAKVLKNIVKWAPRIIAGYGGLNAISDPGVRAAWAKVTKNGEDAKLTVEDWKNIASSLNSIANIARVGRTQYNSKKFGKYLNAEATGTVKVTLKNGTTIDMPAETLKAINKAGNRKGQQAAIDEAVARGISKENAENLRMDFGKTHSPYNPLKRFGNTSVEGTDVMSSVSGNAAKVQQYYDKTYSRAKRLNDYELYKSIQQPLGNWKWPSFSGKFDQYMLSHKKGGVLRAKQLANLVKKGDNGLKATPTWADILGGIYNVDVNNPLAGTASYNYKLMNPDIWDNGDITPYDNLGLGYQKRAYKKLPAGLEDVRKIEGLDYYKQFTSDLYDYNADGTKNYNNGRGGLSELGVRFALDTDKGLPNPGAKIFQYDELGNVKKDANGNYVMNSGWNGLDYSGKPNKKTYLYAADYLDYMRNDLKKANRHNVYGKEGKRYYITKDGKKQYLNYNEIEALKDKGIFTIGEGQDGGHDDFTKWTDYEIKGPETPEAPKTDITDQFLGAGVRPGVKETLDGKNKNLWGKYGPDILNSLAYLGEFALEKPADWVRANPSQHQTPEVYFKATDNGQLIALAQQRANDANAVADSVINNTSDWRAGAARASDIAAQGNRTVNEVALSNKAKYDEDLKTITALANKHEADVVATGNYNSDQRNLTDFQNRERKAAADYINNLRHVKLWDDIVGNPMLKAAAKLLAKQDSIENLMDSYRTFVDPITGEQYQGTTASSFTNEMLRNHPDYATFKEAAKKYSILSDKVLQGLTLTEEELKELADSKEKASDLGTKMRSDILRRQQYMELSALASKYGYNIPKFTGSDDWTAKSTPAARQGMKFIQKTDLIVEAEKLRLRGKDLDRYLKAVDKAIDRHIKALQEIPDYNYLLLKYAP